MHFENYANDAVRHTFDVVDVDLAVVNALRRIVLTDLPVVGFHADAVQMLENNGPLHNEFMTHRISMIPIHFSEKETDAYGTGSADDPAAITFEMDVSNAKTDMLDVTARDIRAGAAGASGASLIARLFPLNPVTGAAVLVTRLRENERLHWTARPVRSTAREHAGFSAVSQCTYTFLQDPAAAAKAAGILDKERAYYRNGFGDPTKIQMRMEVENAFSVRYVVHRAFDILIEKVAGARRAIDAGDASRLTHGPATNAPGYDFTLKKEDDTLGNVIQSLIHVEYMRQPKTTATPITYVGYFCPHPLDETVVVRVVMADAAELGAVAFMQAQLERIQRMLEDLRNEWIEFAPKA